MSNPIFSVNGDLPIATKTESYSLVSLSEKLTCLSSIFSIEVFNLNSTPRFESCFLNSPDVLLSNPGRISLAISTTVTSEPRSLSKLANSQPIAPAPTIQTLLGGSSQLRAVSDVTIKFSSILISGSSLGLEPVARRI